MNHNGSWCGDNEVLSDSEGKTAAFVLNLHKPVKIPNAPCMTNAGIVLFADGTWKGLSEIDDRAYYHVVDSIKKAIEKICLDKGLLKENKQTFTVSYPGCDLLKPDSFSSLKEAIEFLSGLRRDLIKSGLCVVTTHDKAWNVIATEDELSCGLKLVEKK